MNRYRIYDIELSRDYNEIDYMAGFHKRSDIWWIVEETERCIEDVMPIIEAEDKKHITIDDVDTALEKQFPDVVMGYHEIIGFCVEELDDEDED